MGQHCLPPDHSISHSASWNSKLYHCLSSRQITTCHHIHRTKQCVVGLAYRCKKGFYIFYYFFIKTRFLTFFIFGLFSILYWSKSLILLNLLNSHIKGLL